MIDKNTSTITKIVPQPAAAATVVAAAPVMHLKQEGNQSQKSKCRLEAFTVAQRAGTAAAVKLGTEWHQVTLQVGQELYKSHTSQGPRACPSSTASSNALLPSRHAHPSRIEWTLRGCYPPVVSIVTATCCLSIRYSAPTDPLLSGALLFGPSMSSTLQPYGCCNHVAQSPAVPTHCWSLGTFMSSMPHYHHAVALEQWDESKCNLMGGGLA